MKQAIINSDLSVVFEDAPIPTPEEFEVVIKAEAASINPIDWKASSKKTTQDHQAIGKDFAGTVHSVGSKVFQFKPGDRLGAVNHITGFAEYSIGPSFSTFKLPDHVSFDEAATFGLPFYTAALGLFKDMPTPAPWSPARPSDYNPLLIYGASSAVGTYAVKLAVLANTHPIIAVAGAGASDTIENILKPEHGDAIIDYRKHAAPEDLVAAIKAVLPKPNGFKFIVDVISTEYSINKVITQVVDPKESHLVYAATQSFTSSLPSSTSSKMIFAPKLFLPKDSDGAQGINGVNNTGSRAFASAVTRYLEFTLGEGLISAHPLQVLPNGLDSLSQGLQDLKG